MHQKMHEKELRQSFSKSGWALLIYHGIMNAAVTFVMVLDMIIRIIPIILAQGSDLVFSDSIDRTLEEAVVSNGWGYILANLIGFVVLLIWKKKAFCLRDIWISNKGMKPSSLFALLTLLVCGQAYFQISVNICEWIFQKFGISILQTMETTTLTADSLSMFLYAGLIAPIGEEILFRGLILRSFQPYGKKFAILTSAFLFGIFHGNLLQTPYAFLVGLLLGYVATEYSIGWAMVLHMFNNLVVADMIGRITSFFPSFVEELVMLILVWGCVIASIIILIVKRKAVVQYFKAPGIHPLCLKSFVLSPGILVFSGCMILSIVASLLLSFI